MFSAKLNWFDALAAAVVAVLAVLLILSPWQTESAGEYLLVSTPEGETLYRLSEDREIVLSSGGVDLVVEIRGGRARVTESSCPDGVCVAGGWISESGETVLCAPARVRITVKGGDGDVDFVAG